MKSIFFLAIAFPLAFAPPPRIVLIDMIIPPKCVAPCLVGLNARGEWKSVKLDASIELADSGGVPVLRAVPVIIPPSTNPSIRRIQVLLIRQADGSLLLPASAPNPIPSAVSIYLGGIYLAPSSTTWSIDPQNTRRIITAGIWQDGQGIEIPVSADYLYSEP